MSQKYNPGYAVAKRIVPSDTVNIDGTTSTTGANVKCADALWVPATTATTVTVLTQDGTQTGFSVFLGSNILPVRVMRVKATGTTPTALVALYETPGGIV